MTDTDTELHLVRALTPGGLKLSGDVSSDDRRERIRIAILVQKLENRKFAIGPGHLMETYAEAYERCYDRKIDMRKDSRDAYGRPLLAPLPVIEDEDFKSDDDE